MERRIQQAENKMSTSGRQQSEAEELRRELEEARMAEHIAKIQLQEARVPPSPSLSTPASNTSFHSAGIMMVMVVMEHYDPYTRGKGNIVYGSLPVLVAWPSSGMVYRYVRNQDREWVEMRGIAVAAFVMDEARMERESR